MRPNLSIERTRLGSPGLAFISFGEPHCALLQHDVLVVPCWLAHTLHASSELVLFSYSDRVAQEKLGFFREQRS